MIQIIGWMLCIYLIVKGFELLAMQPNGDKGRQLAIAGALIAFIAAPIFFFMLNAQAKSGGDSLSRTQSYSECIRSASTVAEMSRCKPD
jgi:hypothetical protein